MAQMHPLGMDLSPSRVLAIVKGEDDLVLHPEDNGLPKDAAMVIYWHEDGEDYALGRKCQWELWKQVGYQSMGSVDLIKELLQSADRSGVKEKSIAWYLLRDFEREDSSPGSECVT
jgi:hypothetical protein